MDHWPVLDEAGPRVRTKRKQVFRTSTLRKICGVTRRDRTQNLDIRKNCSWEGHCGRFTKSQADIFWTYRPSLVWLTSFLTYISTDIVPVRGRGRWNDDIQEDCKLMDVTVREASATRIWKDSVEIMRAARSRKCRHRRQAIKGPFTLSAVRSDAYTRTYPRVVWIATKSSKSGTFLSVVINVSENNHSIRACPLRTRCEPPLKVPAE